MLVLVGTIPIDGMPLVYGQCEYNGETLKIGDTLLEGRYVTLGTAALICAACQTSKAVNAPMPYACVVGDTGMGEGNRKLFNYLIEHVTEIKPTVMTLHYILPTRDLFAKLLDEVDKIDPRPFMIADAGALLNAKALGVSKRFDLFTPDPGELSFLADKEAAHPAYVQHFIFDVDQTEVPKLSKQAYDDGNSPKYMIVKAPVDHVIVDGKVVAVINEPNVPALEPIGGTGDTITGESSALIAAGFEPEDALEKASKINRVAGEMANPIPSTTISQFIPHIFEAARKVIG